MTIHLNLLAEEAEEALQRETDLREQVATVALDVTQARPGPIRSLLRRVARRHGG